MFTGESIQELAHACGFTAVGWVPFELQELERERLAGWIAAGRHGRMAYLERSLPHRHDARALFPEVQSVVAVLSSYKRTPDDEARCLHEPFVARYAWGEDYHAWMKSRLRQMLRQLQQQNPAVRGRAVVDSAPTFERAWAVRAGLGWVGRSSLLIHPLYGSYTNLGLLLLNIPCPEPPADPVENRCGACRRCVEACPTGAICADSPTIDARRCIAYQTLSLSGGPEESFRPLLGGRIFGCDACLEACPYNEKAPTGHHRPVREGRIAEIRTRTGNGPK